MFLPLSFAVLYRRISRVLNPLIDLVKLNLFCEKSNSVKNFCFLNFASCTTPCDIFHMYCKRLRNIIQHFSNNFIYYLCIIDKMFTITCFMIYLQFLAL